MGFVDCEGTALNYNFLKRMVLLGWFFLAMTGWAEPLSRDRLPAGLQPWVDWVLRDEKGLTCSKTYNDGGQSLCLWAAALRLDLTEEGGSFVQSGELQEQGTVPLPGEIHAWPREVKVNGKAVPVLAKEKLPVVNLPAGYFEITGIFQWATPPEQLLIPGESALVTLTMGGKPVAFPQRDGQGRLWLAAREPAQTAADHLEITVHRKLADDIPFTLTTRLELNIAGKNREIVLDQPVQEKMLPLSVSSRLPVRVEEDGRLRIQGKPGRWEVDLVQRYQGELSRLSLPVATGVWANEEIWVFQSLPHLRSVTLSGLTAIDPQQTTLPQEWRRYPAFLVKGGESLVLQENKRGDPQPPPDQLTLQRHWWLDFDGRGWTAQDHISGVLHQPQRLEMVPPVALGQLSIGQEAQFITRRGASQQSGVEVAEGDTRIQADSRLESQRADLPAVGWNHDFSTVSASLHLPPGWRLWGVMGVDKVSDSWIDGWSMLDLFLLTILTIAASRLWGVGCGVVTLGSVGLIHPEMEAITWLLFHWLVAQGILQLVKTGGLHRFLKFYRLGVGVALAMAGLVFLLQQAHFMLHPYLEETKSAAQAYYPPPVPMSMLNQDAVQSMENNIVSQEMVKPMQQSERTVLPRAMAPAPQGKGERKKSLSQKEANLMVQTGPGLPLWHGHGIELSWNGPVLQGQEMQLVLTSPGINQLLALLRMLLLLAVLAVFVESPALARGWCVLSRHFKKGTVALLLLALCYPPDPVMAELPSPELLEALRQNQTQKADCLPACADLSQLRVEVVNGTVLRLSLDVHADRPVAVPLPGPGKQWLPQRVMVDQAATTFLRRGKDDFLWLNAPAGRSLVVLEGPLPNREALFLSLPMAPRRLALATGEWRVSGVQEGSRAEGAIQLHRPSRAAGAVAETGEALPPSQLPPLLLVERRLVMGLDWRMQTKVKRLSPVGVPILEEIPLWEGESVITPGLPVTAGKVAIKMAPDSRELQWESVVEEREKLELTAPKTNRWHEVWQLEVSNLWHVESSGLPQIRQANGSSDGLRVWRPWPEERLTIVVDKPQGAPGRTLTLEKSTLNGSLGLRAMEMSWQLQLKSSRGGEHQVRIPADAVLLKLAINGVQHPATLDQGRLTLPLSPGMVQVEIVWREDRPFALFETSAAVDAGLPGVNAYLTLSLPRDRMVLWSGGPALGPVVLFWGVVVVLLVAALALGRLPLTPLGSRQWFLLGLGLVSVGQAEVLMVASWFLLFGWRQRTDIARRWLFNLRQVGLALWTLACLATLFAAIQQGLLGFPDLYVTGNGSSAFHLSWYQDRFDGTPQPAWLVAIPVWTYHVAMLLWSTWLAWALLGWARWGWDCFTGMGRWRGSDAAKEENPTSAS